MVGWRTLGNAVGLLLTCSVLLLILLEVALRKAIEGSSAGRDLLADQLGSRRRHSNDDLHRLPVAGLHGISPVLFGQSQQLNAESIEFDTKSDASVVADSTTTSQESNSEFSSTSDGERLDDVNRRLRLLSSNSSAWEANGTSSSSRNNNKHGHHDKQDCISIDRIIAVHAPPSSSLSLPRHPFSVSTLTLDPSRRHTGLPLRLSSWPASSAFVIATGEPGKGHRTSLIDLDKGFRQAGLRYTQALWPQNISDVFAAKYHPLYPSSGAKLQRHELAYLLSHVEIWARIVIQRLPFALVFEDDLVQIEKPQDWKARMEVVLRQLNLLILQRGNRFFFDLLLLSRRPLAPFAEQRLTSHILRAQPSQSVSAYLISFSGAKRLLAGAHLTAPLSETIAIVPGLTILASDPPFFRPPPACRPQPCRAHPSSAYTQASLSLSLSPACQATLMLGFPGHPRIRGNKLRQDWQQQAQQKQGAVVTVGGDSQCGTPAQCLIRWKLKHLRAPAPPPAVRTVVLAMPAQLAMWQAFVIGLQDDKERFAELEPQLQRHGFGLVTKANAISLDNTDFTVLRHLVVQDKLARTRNSPWWLEKSETRKYLSKGEVGCALSHYFVWLEVIRQGLPYAIVVEDDVVFLSDQFREEFERDVEEANFLLTQKGDYYGPDVVFLGKAGLMTSYYTPHLTQHIVQSPLVWCSFAYIVSLEGARRLTRDFFLNDPLDSYWWQVPGMRFWSFEPSLADHQTVKKSKSKRSHFQSRVQSTDAQW